MYSKTAMPVEIPKEGGRIRTLKNGYVYWLTKSHWDATKKQTVDNRVCIGKKVPEKEGWIYPNPKFFTLFGSVADSQKTPSLPFAKRGKFHTHINYGVYFVLRESALLCGCHEALVRAFSSEVANKIFAIAMYAIDAQSSVAQGFSDWCFDNYCGLARPLQDSEISSLYASLAEHPQNIDAFKAYFREAYYEAFPAAEYNALAFDSTNQNTHSKGIGMAEFGHAKVNEQLPIINTALFVDEETGIPLYYEHFCGSLLDKSQTPFTLEKAHDLGFQHLFLMMDRGYMTKETLEALREDTFGVMCPEGLLFTKEIIARNRTIIKDCEQFYIASEDIYGIHLPGTEYAERIYDAYVYYDARRAQDERDSIHARIKFLTDKAMLRKRFTEKLKESFAPWLVVEKLDGKDDNGRNFTVSGNVEEIQKCLDDAGYFVILSNASLGADKMIRMARMRDRGEKGFRRIKYHLGLSKTYVHSLKTFEGKMFVAFVALIVVEAFRYFVKKILMARSSETTATLLSEMRKYKIMLKNSGEWMPLYAVTAKQKSILQSVKRTAPDLENAVRKLRLRV